MTARNLVKVTYAGDTYYVGDDNVVRLYDGTPVTQVYPDPSRIIAQVLRKLGRG